jgi:hypothetical protein
MDRTDMRNAFRRLARNPEGGRRLRMHSNRWEDNIKMVLKKDGMRV